MVWRGKTFKDASCEQRPGHKEIIKQGFQMARTWIFWRCQFWTASSLLILEEPASHTSSLPEWSQISDPATAANGPIIVCLGLS